MSKVYGVGTSNKGTVGETGPLYHAVTELVTGSDKPKKPKVIARVRSKPVAEQFVKALTLAQAFEGTIYSRLSAEALAVFGELSNYGVGVVIENDELPTILFFKGKVRIEVSGDKLFMGDGQDKLLVKAFKKRYGMAPFNRLQTLLVEESLRLGFYENAFAEAVEKTAPAGKPVIQPIKEPLKKAKDPASATTPKKASKATTEKVNDAWKKGLGENWPDPQA